MHISNSKKFAALIKQLVITSILLFVQIVVFYFSASNLIVGRSSFYFITAFIHYVVSIAVQLKLNPELLVQRLKINRNGSKLWDEILMRLSNLMVIILIPAIIHAFALIIFKLNIIIE